MKEERFRFLELLGNIDDELIYLSCQPWEEKTRTLKRYLLSKGGKVQRYSQLVPGVHRCSSPLREVASYLQ